MRGNTDRRPPLIGWVAVMLAAVAGGVDAVGYLALFHLFVAHMSGNSVGLAADLARAQWREAGMRGLPVPFFVIGIVVGAVAAELAARRHSRRSLAATLVFELIAIAALTATGMVLAPHGSVGAPLGWRFCVIAVLAAFAMGLQNGMVRRLNPRSRGTTYVTGLLTLLSESVASMLLSRGRRADPARDGADRRSGAALRYVAIYAAYIVGAGATTLGYQAWAFAALVIPMSGLTALIVRDWCAPIASGDQQPLV